MFRSRCALFLFLLLAGVAAHAQKTEVSLTFGAALSPDGKGPVTCGEAIICPIPQGAIGPVHWAPESHGRRLWSTVWRISGLRRFTSNSLLLVHPRELDLASALNFPRFSLRLQLT